MPCGYCGRSNNGKCDTSSKITARKTEIICGCAYKVAFKYGYAGKGSDTTPCRNVPVICPLCPMLPNPPTAARPAIWRYNMEEHIRTYHPEYASPTNPIGLKLSQAAWNAVRININEEHSARIPSNRIPPPFTAIEEDEYDIEMHRPRAPFAGQKRRGNAASNNESNSSSKKSRCVG